MAAPAVPPNDTGTGEGSTPHCRGPRPAVGQQLAIRCCVVRHRREPDQPLPEEGGVQHPIRDPVAGALQRGGGQNMNPQKKRRKKRNKTANEKKQKKSKKNFATKSEPLPLTQDHRVSVLTKT